MTGAAVVALVAAVLVGTSCSDPEGVAPISRDRLTPGKTFAADLDADGALEEIFVDETDASLTISDGGVVYRSRDKWRVVEAHLGDTDQDGLLEVVTLLDSDEGRHIGLFAYFGGEYRERLVTSEITPRPITLEVVNFEEAIENGVIVVGFTGDLIALTQEPGAGQTGSQTTLLRWNGFGFTGLESAVTP